MKRERVLTLDKNMTWLPSHDVRPDRPAVFSAATIQPMLSHINVGTGTDISIRELAGMVAEVTDFQGTIRCDSTKPDGTPRKLLDVSRLARLGWRARIELRDGITQTYRWYLDHAASLRA